MYAPQLHLEECFGGVGGNGAGGRYKIGIFRRGHFLDFGKCPVCMKWEKDSEWGWVSIQIILDIK